MGNNIFYNLNRLTINADAVPMNNFNGEILILLYYVNC